MLPTRRGPRDEHTQDPRTSSPVNRAAARRFLLEFAAANKHHPFTRVSEATLDNFEAFSVRWLRNHVLSAPSRGQTL